MKKSTILIACLLGTATMIGQNRGSRGGNYNYNTIQTNVSNPTNGNTFIASNVDNNTGVFNQSNVQMTNVNLNVNKVQQQTINVPRNVDNRNVTVNYSNDDIQLVNVSQSRGGDVQTVNFNGNRGGNEVVFELDNNIEINEVFDNGPGVQQQMIIDNVDNGIAMNLEPQINVPQVQMPEINVPNINIPEINVPQVQMSMDVSLDLSRNNGQVKTNKVKEEKVKEEKVYGEGPSFEMPSVKLNLSFGTSKKSITTKKMKSKGQRDFGYKQHVSILAKMATKFTKVKKVLAKKKTKKSKLCSVICYQF